MYFVAAVLMVLSGLFYAAGNNEIGSLGADVCRYGGTFCDSPVYVWPAPRSQRSGVRLSASAEATGGTFPPKGPESRVWQGSPVERASAQAALVRARAWVRSASPPRRPLARLHQSSCNWRPQRSGPAGDSRGHDRRSALPARRKLQLRSRPPPAPPASVANDFYRPKDASAFDAPDLFPPVNKSRMTEKVPDR